MEEKQLIFKLARKEDDGRSGVCWHSKCVLAATELEPAWCRPVFKLRSCHRLKFGLRASVRIWLACSGEMHLMVCGESACPSTWQGRFMASCSDCCLQFLSVDISNTLRL